MTDFAFPKAVILDDPSDPHAANGLVAASTPIGLAIIRVLAINANPRPTLRRLLAELGDYPPAV